MREFNLTSKANAHEVKAHPDRDTILVAMAKLILGYGRPLPRITQW